MPRFVLESGYPYIILTQSRTDEDIWSFWSDAYKDNVAEAITKDAREDGLRTMIIKIEKMDEEQGEEE